MANELQTKLDAILLDKNTNLLPENLKKDITCLGVTGTLEAGSGSSDIKIFNTIDEMNNSTDNNDGDIALVCSMNYVTPNTTEFTANALILPKYLPKSVFVNMGDNFLLEGVGLTNLSRLYALMYDNEININFESGFGGSGSALYRINNSTNQYERQSDNGVSYMFSLIDNNFGNSVASGGYNVSSLKVYNDNMEIWNYIKFVNLGVIGVYYYDSNSSKWNVYKNTYTSIPNKIQSGYTAFGKTGVITGTLDLAAKKKFGVIPYYDVSYSGGIVNNGKTLVQNITPTEGGLSLGDNRYLIVFGQMMENKYAGAYWIDPSSTTKYITYDGGHLDTYMDDTLIKKKMGTVLDNLTPDMSALINSKSLNNLTNTNTTLDSVEYYAICTNMEIRDGAGNVLVPEGPSAAKTLKGQYYINIFGEKIEGAYEPNYTELGTISPTEYDTAVATSEDILGTTTE